MESLTARAAEFHPLADEWMIDAYPDERTRVLKHGDTFAVFDRYGDILAAHKGQQGLYHRDTRFLYRSRLYLNGKRPLLLSSTISEDNAVLTADLANASDDREDVVQREVVHILRSKFLWQAACYERLELRNYGREPMQVSLEYEFDADFADIFEVRGAERARRGRVRPAEVHANTVVHAYEGLDGIPRHTRLSFQRPPEELGATFARFTLELGSGGSSTLDIIAECLEGLAVPPASDTGVGFELALGQARAALRTAEDESCRIETANEQFNDWIHRSLADLNLLTTETAWGPYVYAGIPWFNTAFGRDGLITALQMLWVRPEIAAGVARFLAAGQSDSDDPMNDAQQGKVLHETRSGEMSATGEVPFARYYGSVDATPLFVVLVGEYVRATGDERFAREMWSHVERALDWIDTYGDADGDGFIEYSRQSGDGLVNQGWKDSADSVFHADGSNALGPIALCEVQGYVYAARRHAARLARIVGEHGRAATLDRAAAILQTRFDEAFWCEDLGTYALALDGQKTACRVRASNAGHCLFTGIALPRRAPRVAETLLSPAFFTGWGVRTLAEGEARYNPMSYHNGSVWPHDNALIAAGMARYGLRSQAVRVLAGMFDASLFVELHRLPELFCGFERRWGEGPTLYPVACMPQAWAAGAPFMMLAAVLGMSLEGGRGELRFEHPELPRFLEDVRVFGLRVGNGSIDLELTRHPNDVGLTVDDRRGAVTVVITK